MARRRMIDPSFWSDSGIGSLSIPARLLFVALFSNADDEGRIDADARSLRRLAFGFDAVTDEEMSTWMLEILSNLRSVIAYVHTGRMYIQLANWKCFQSINRPYASRIPAPDDERSMIIHAPFSERSVNDHAQISERSMIIHAPFTERSLPVQESTEREVVQNAQPLFALEPEDANPQTARQELLEAFERFWEKYPRREGRGRAEKKWLKDIRLPWVPDLMRALDRLILIKAGKSAEFVPLATTWLNDRKWRDSLTDELPGVVAEPRRIPVRTVDPAVKARFEAERERRMAEEGELIAKLRNQA